ncbi:D-xylose transport system substrate-binding protein [Nonomuraea polychroma]|uniref:D-xylose transport system substrate-binding protein n=1 Tax=Nonomuraea polychroma TaxID=46176 RepID=A0A438MDT1_9ACTN|nr:sugar ABC transporter substrate-binding protein [Nonomuraea polychroma]RVX43906.1 D-xylose transport system substrate-binding protein [Nonomuraea polychroma]
MCNRSVLAGIGAAVALLASACASPDAVGAGGSAAMSGKIALLLPDANTTRYESFDRPYFEAKVKSLCAGCEVVYANADNDAAKQQQQAESALTQGVKALVLDPVDSAAAASVVDSAKQEKVPVVAYDRFIKNAPIDYYISFDNEKVGRIQGQALVDKLKSGGATGGILMVNGSPTDNNATLFKKGAHSVIDSSGVKVLAEYDTPDWNPDKARQWVAGQLTQHTGRLAGIYAANDGTGGGAIAAMKAEGVDPLLPVTGQDAELAAIQRVITGEQFITVYKAIRPEAELAAQVAVALIKGDKPQGATKVDGVAATLLEPLVVTKDNVADTVIKDGFHKVSDICTAEYAKACTAAGLS